MRCSIRREVAPRGSEPGFDDSKRRAAQSTGPTRRTLLLKHQIGGALAAVVDFTVMTLAVELLDVAPVPATALGALVGAVTSFLLGRRWVFQATAGQVGGQAVRYALVSAGSLGLNSLGEYLFLRYTSLHYLVARLIVATAVGIGWNFSMHRWFVFRAPYRGAEAGAA